MNDRWKEMTEEDISTLLKEGINVFGENKDFRFADNLKDITIKE